MVGDAEYGHLATPDDGLVRGLQAEYPELIEIAAAARGTPVYAVGGAVRDLILGRPRTDLDLVVEGDPIAITEKLGGPIAVHDRFLTVTARVGELDIDLARARTEIYRSPGTLPEVAPADLAADLRRRDFTVNAMALPIDGSGGKTGLIDPFGGYDDLGDGVLRALHRQSFEDDPTRVLRGARYAASYNLVPDPITAEMIVAVDIDTVSRDRREAELRKILAGPEAITALRLLAEWGVIDFPEGALSLAERIHELAATPLWAEEFDLVEATMPAIEGEVAVASDLAALRPSAPIEAVEVAARHSPEVLALARALGAEWLDHYLCRWRGVELEIDGSDLIAAGVGQGPSVGRGLREALRLKLAGEVVGREQELEVALTAAVEGHDALG